MRLLFMHAKGLRIEADRTSKKAINLSRRLAHPLPDAGKPHPPLQSPNALLCLVCVESGDKGLGLEPVRDEILRSRALLGVPEIVLGAFAHLSDEAAGGEEAQAVVLDLLALVRASHGQTRTSPFCWDKSLGLDFPCHHYNVSFRTFRPGRGPWSDIASAYERYMERSGHFAAQRVLLESFLTHRLLDGPALDICCGPGLALSVLASSGTLGLLVGLDREEGMIRAARRRLWPCPARGMVSLVQGDAEDLPLLFSSGAFRSILMINASAYVDLEILLPAIARLSSPQSSLLVMEESPFMPTFLEGSGFPAGALPPSWPSASEVAELAGSFGFRSICGKSMPIDASHSLEAVLLLRRT